MTHINLQGFIPEQVFLIKGLVSLAIPQLFPLTPAIDSKLAFSGDDGLVRGVLARPAPYVMETSLINPRLT